LEVGVAEPWWQSAVVYQIYPRSFADGSGDGVGDLTGIREHLDHVAWLGVDAIWLSPFYRSPMADGGYDVSDHTDVDPLFGTLSDFDRLLAEAHDRQLRVLIDWVPNHTSDQHPWFRDSRATRRAPRRRWYIWRDEPNNWVAAFGSGSAWTLDPASGQRYLHLFLPEQPDLNWQEPGVVEAMHGVLRFWLDRGVDGFRVDAIHCVGKDPTFADDPRCATGRPLSDFNDQPATHDMLRGVRRVVDAYAGDRLLVGEVNVRDTEAVLRYHGQDDELHLSFNFRLLDAAWDAAAVGDVVAEVERWFGPGVWPTWVLSNHDNRRHRTRYGGSERRARAAAVLLLTLRGTPFLYQGEELGLDDALVPDRDRVDPGGRDGCRAPLPWTAGAPHGWAGAVPWLPFPPDAGGRSVEAQRADPGSILHLYRALLGLRRDSPALRFGALARVPSPSDVLAYIRHAPPLGIGNHRRAAEGRPPADARAVAVNFAGVERALALEGAWRYDLASDGRIEPGSRFTGRLAAEQAVVLHPDRAG
jgi:alpha-glucosidase